MWGDPNYPTVYCSFADILSPAKTILLSMTYVGSQLHGFNGEVGTQPPTGSADTRASWDFTVLSADLTTAFHTFDARYDATVFANPNVDGFQDGHVTLGSRAGIQDSMGWRMVFDPVSKTVSAMMSSFLQLPAAYCGIHTFNTATFNPWIITTHDDLLGAGGESYLGPYNSPVTSDGGAGIGSIPSSFDFCD